MKKATMNAILSIISTINTPEADEVRAELNAELAKGEAKAQANRDLYAEAHDVVIEAMSHLTAPATIAELYDEVADALPEGMTKGKLQYAVTRLWSDEIVKTEGKVNTYSLKA
jgi:Mg/Co/Ni transporter MgtE